MITLIKKKIMSEETTMEAGSAKRPAFLTVLCILTFIGAGLGLLGGFGQFAIDATMGGITVLANALCIVGAIMMMKLKKTGFFLYLVGELLPLIYTFLVLGGLGAMSIPMLGDAIIVVYIIALVIPLTFIIMYGLNLKHMK